MMDQCSTIVAIKLPSNCHQWPSFNHFMLNKKIRREKLEANNNKVNSSSSNKAISLIYK